MKVGFASLYGFLTSTQYAVKAEYSHDLSFSCTNNFIGLKLPMFHRSHKYTVYVLLCLAEEDIGAIVGIVFGCVFGALLIGILIWWTWRKGYCSGMLCHITCLFYK